MASSYKGKLFRTIWASTSDFGAQLHTRQSLPLNAHSEIYSGATCPHFGLSFHLYTYFMYASSQGSGKSAHCTDLPEPPLLNNVISTKISGAGSFKVNKL